MKKYIIITGDYNDGDYITERTAITDIEIALIQPLINAIKNSTTDCNWENPNDIYGEIPGFQFFESLVPCHEYSDIHSICSIEILVVIEEIKLL